MERVQETMRAQWCWMSMTKYILDEQEQQENGDQAFPIEKDHGR